MMPHQFEGNNKIWLQKNLHWLFRRKKRETHKTTRVEINNGQDSVESTSVVEDSAVSSDLSRTSGKNLNGSHFHHRFSKSLSKECIVLCKTRHNSTGWSVKTHVLINPHDSSLSSDLSVDSVVHNERSPLVQEHRWVIWSTACVPQP